MSDILNFPHVIACHGTPIEIRHMTADDADAVIAFANSVPLHDLLFLERDIRNPKVVAAWIDQLAGGSISTLLAFSGDQVVGCAAIVRDAFSWSRHVGEIRIVVSTQARGCGLGRTLIQDAFALALSLDMAKVMARMTPDQQGAISLFEDLGFRPEALLKDHVRDADGGPHDIVIFSLDLVRARAQREAYGLG